MNMDGMNNNDNNYNGYNTSNNMNMNNNGYNMTNNGYNMNMNNSNNSGQGKKIVIIIVCIVVILGLVCCCGVGSLALLGSKYDESNYEGTSELNEYEDDYEYNDELEELDKELADKIEKELADDLDNIGDLSNTLDDINNTLDELNNTGSSSSGSSDSDSIVLSEDDFSLLDEVYYDKYGGHSSIGLDDAELHVGYYNLPFDSYKFGDTEGAQPGTVQRISDSMDVIVTAYNLDLALYCELQGLSDIPENWRSVLTDEVKSFDAEMHAAVLLDYYKKDSTYLNSEVYELYNNSSDEKAYAVFVEFTDNYYLGYICYENEYTPSGTAQFISVETTGNIQKEEFIYLFNSVVRSGDALNY